MSDFEVYRSPTGVYEARIPISNFARRSQIEVLLEPDQEGLNRHISDKHLAQPGAMNSHGYQFDGELALFLGLSLDDVAQETQEVVTALSDGSFARTEAYRKITQTYLQPYETIADAIWKTRTFNYQQRVAAELGALVRLGVVSPGLVNSNVQQAIVNANVLPVTKDSFFKRFGVTKVEAAA